MKNVFKDHVNFLIMIAMALAMAMFSCSSDSDDAPPSPQSYDFCITAGNDCLTGPFTASTCNGQLSNSCPNEGGGTSSSSTVSSSSDVSSSSALGSSSSTVSSSSDVSSSSALGSSSSSEPSVPDGAVKIGNQIWKKENLNIDADGSKCYNNDPANCAKYGRLYDWATVMNLPANCNSETCASLIAAKHRGLCPAGWHIPSDAEWTTLTTAVGGTSTAGKKLKAADGWNSGGNGDDTYGFAALPGGYGFSDGSFGNAGNYGYWWSASEYDSYNAYGRRMYYYYEFAGWGYSGKSSLFSVRCLQD